MKKKFTADQFAPTKFGPSEDKAKFASQFVKFVESDFQINKFPKWFYFRLSMTFGHIAHYNQLGFYETFFTTPRGKVEFIEACRDGGGYGDPEYTYSDVEKALKKWLIENAVLKNYQQKFQAALDDIERAWHAAEKYRKTING